MSKIDITAPPDDAQRRNFVRALLEDVHALERMLAEGWIEEGVRRIGAEQEMFLVDRGYEPSNKALAILERLGSGSYTTELALFNLEANLAPRVLEKKCLSEMQTELDQLVDAARVAAEQERTKIILCGILPTLGKEHLGLDSMTPIPRYLQMNRIMVEQRGGRFQTLIKGTDELQTTHENVMLEACNTSFQLHYQVGAKEYARLYNLAQVVTAPVLAAAVNSPVLLRHRLWHETRVALFQQSLDTRSEHQASRGTRQRVSFGDRWLKGSILEIYREDIARFRALITTGSSESPMEMLDQGQVPPLKALRLHNGTVYRWNRPCYGVHEGQAHLRIESRAFPAGPSTVDEVANAALFYGLMTALDTEYGDVTKRMSFDDAKANFVAAARYGLHARFRWFDGKSHGADELLLKHLVPLARKGLEARKIDKADIDKYLGIVEERVQAGRTGAQWALDSLAQMGERGKAAERFQSLVAAMEHNQAKHKPVHTWELATLRARAVDKETFRTVGQIMTTDLFTVQAEDIVDLAASLMDWEHLRHVPVEDKEGRLVGLVSHRALMRILSRGSSQSEHPVAVREVMETEPMTVTPETSTLEAIEAMRKHGTGCLPVVQDGRLVGIVTEHDFFEIAGTLLERWLRDE